MEKNEIKFYKELAEKNRGTPRQFGYGSEKSQLIRFFAMSKMLQNLCEKTNKDIKDLIILDFGCGKGDFENHIKCKKYYGVDAIEENIEDALKREQNNDCEFKLMNWDGKSAIFRERPDVVVFSGSFATTTARKRNDSFLSLLNMSNYGIVGTFLTHNEQVKVYENGCILTKASEIIGIIDNSRFMIQLDMSYLPHDFTIGAIKWPSLL